MGKLFSILIFVLILFSSLIFAQPPFQTSGESVGLIIEVPQYEVIPLRSNFTFYFHVFNATNGVNINTTNCTSHIYDYENGHHILEINNIPLDSNGIDFEVEINDTFFTKSGAYYQVIQCQYNGQAGGFFGYSFKVGDSIREGTLQESIVISILLIIFIVLFVTCLVLAFIIDGNNKFTIGENGEPLVELNTGKYLKLFLYLLSYLFLWLTTWACWQVSNCFLLVDHITGILRIIFIIETIFWFPLLLILVSIGLIKHFADINLEKTTRRGLFPRK